MPQDTIRPLVVGSSGQTIKINVGFDFTGYDEIGIQVQKPDGSAVVEKLSGDGVSDGADPAAGYLYYVIEEDFCPSTAPVGIWIIHPVVWMTATKKDPHFGFPPVRLPVVKKFKES